VVHLATTTASVGVGFGLRVPDGLPLNTVVGHAHDGRSIVSASKIFTQISRSIILKFVEHGILSPPFSRQFVVVVVVVKDIETLLAKSGRS
jgi:hypothetical protein